MRDREPLHQGRMRFDPVSGQPNTYDMSMADGATEEGTPLNKETMLNDLAADFVGLGDFADPTVSDAFIALGLVARNKAMIILHVTVNGEPATAGVRIQGLTDIYGANMAETDSFGDARGFASSTGSISVTSPYLDLTGSATVGAELGKITSGNLALTSAAREADFTASRQILFSPYIVNYNVDVCCVGAGGGGGGGCPGDSDNRNGGGGGGGGGGYVTNASNVNVTPNVIYNVTIGAGGATGRNSGAYGVNASGGASGGSTSFAGVTASGGRGGGGGTTKTSGAGGAGNGSGGAGGTRNANGGAGNNGTVRKYGDENGALFGGGGGGGGYGETNNNYGAGGSPYGGHGGGFYADGAAQAGTGAGGGGGGCCSQAYNVRQDSAPGGNGQVSCRWRAKT